jgi:hypothetical protein
MDQIQKAMRFETEFRNQKKSLMKSIINHPNRLLKNREIPKVRSLEKKMWNQVREGMRNQSVIQDLDSSGHVEISLGEENREESNIFSKKRGIT